MKFSLLSAINRNGLFYFLLANLVTGIINIHVPTIHIPPVPSFTIIFLYLLIVSLVVSILHFLNVTVKYW